MTYIMLLALLLSVTLLSVNAAALQTTSRMAENCADCFEDSDCASLVCYPSTSSGGIGFCVRSFNFYDIFPCSRLRLQGAKSKTTKSRPATASSPSPSPSSEAAPQIISTSFTTSSEDSGKGSGSSSASSPCDACMSGSDCQPRDNDFRCVNGRCVRSLRLYEVEQCFPDGVTDGFGSVSNCKQCEFGQNCASGVCINNKCHAEAGYEAVIACRQ